MALRGWAPLRPSLNSLGESSKPQGIMCVVMACDKGGRIKSLLCRLNKMQEAKSNKS